MPTIEVSDETLDRLKTHSKSYGKPICEIVSDLSRLHLPGFQHHSSAAREGTIHYRSSEAAVSSPQAIGIENATITGRKS
jgi:hypothetical protein